MAFVKISEQSSLYNDLEKKPVREILEEINTEDHKVADAVQKAIPNIEKLVEGIVERMKKGGRIFYIGAGTSGRLGVLDASEIPPTFGMDPSWVIGVIAGGDTALRNAVENAEDDTEQGWKDLEKFNINSKDTLIGIAASGTTPYVIGALKTARANGLLTAAITSNPDAPVSEAAEIPIEMVVGPEYVTGSSRMKSGTGQKMICNMITTSVMIKRMLAEEEPLIVRSVNPLARHSFNIRLSARGEALVDNLVAKHLKTVTTLLTPLNHEERQSLQEILEKLS